MGATELSQEFWPCCCYEFSKAASENKRLSVALVKHDFILFTSFTDSSPRHTPAPPLFVWVTPASGSSIIYAAFTGAKVLVATSEVHCVFGFFFTGVAVHMKIEPWSNRESRRRKLSYSGGAMFLKRTLLVPHKFELIFRRIFCPSVYLSLNYCETCAD